MSFVVRFALGHIVVKMFNARASWKTRPGRPRMKMVTVGDQGAGKTTLLLKGLSQAMPSTKDLEDVGPTVGLDFAVHYHEASDGSGDTAMVECWDMSGQERFYSLSLGYVRKASAVVIVYDTTQEPDVALNSVKRWHNVVQQVREDALLLPLVIVANKTDLTPNFRAKHTKVANWCVDNNVAHFFTSALVGDHDSVKAPLSYVIEAALARLREQRENDAIARRVVTLSLEPAPQRSYAQCPCGT